MSGLPLLRPRSGRSGILDSFRHCQQPVFATPRACDEVGLQWACKRRQGAPFPATCGPSNAGLNL